MTSTESTVVVAPREISDLVDRCCRVAGLGASASLRIAKAVSFAEAQDQAALGPFFELVDGQTICSVLTAMDRLAVAEVASISEGPQSITFSPPVPTPLLAYSMSECNRRGRGASVPDPASASTATIIVGGGTASGSGTTMMGDAARNGVSIARAHYDRLATMAAEFLVAEATLDAIFDG